MTLIVEKLRTARTLRVHAVNRVELNVDLGFGIQVARVFTLSDLKARDVPEALRSAAVHAVVVLLGGKSVYVQPEHERPDCRYGRLYLNERVHGQPVGLVQHVANLPRPILDVGMFLGWLAEREFDLDLVKEVINGRSRRSEVTDGSSSIV